MSAILEPSGPKDDLFGTPSPPMIDTSLELMEILDTMLAPSENQESFEEHLRQMSIALNLMCNELPEDFVPGEEIIHEKTGMTMIAIPPGTFLFGADKSPKLIAVPFYISKYHTTWEQYLRFCKETGYPEPPRPSFEYDDTHPVVNVNWYDCKKFCEWGGLDLPTEEQWEYAVRGTDGRAYPWGDKWDPKMCVNNATGTESVFSETGERGKSPFGLCHAVGNVWCWTNTEESL